MKTTVDASLPGAGPGPRYLLATSESGLTVHPLPAEGEVVLGRGPECAVVLDDAKVSREHARLRLGERATLTDLGSRNGTFVNGARLPPDHAQEVAAGDSFSVGRFTLILLPPGSAPALQTAVGSRLQVEDPRAENPPPLLAALARSPLSVVIHGETGVGKEVLARTLHRLSGRSGPFLGVNCAALTESLLESELFGHEKGAFTGALGKPGLLEAAAGGTVLLDEVGEMGAAAQAKLLRAIETREVLRVGAVRPVPIDVRIVAATHRDLFHASQFRRDLFYRLAVVTLEIPPLRARRDRIGALAVELLADAAARAGVPASPLSVAATALLVAHDWPGNVRELRNVLDRALLLAQGGELRPAHILFDAAAPADPLAQPAVAAVRDGDERARIVAALDACAGNQTRAARLLGVSRPTLVHKLALHGIPRPRR